MSNIDKDMFLAKYGNEAQLRSLGSNTRNYYLVRDAALCSLHSRYDAPDIGQLFDKHMTYAVNHPIEHFYHWHDITHHGWVKREHLEALLNRFKKDTAENSFKRDKIQDRMDRL